MKIVGWATSMVISTLLHTGSAYGLDLSVIVDCEYKELSGPREEYTDYEITCRLTAEDSLGAFYILGHRDIQTAKLERQQLVVRTSSYQKISTDVVKNLQLVGGSYQNSALNESPTSISISTSPICAANGSTQVKESFEVQLSSFSAIYTPVKKQVITLTHPSENLAYLICSDRSGLMQMVNGQRLYRFDQFPIED
jgi:hypothetical protein